MTYWSGGLTAFSFITIALIVLVAVRPSLTAARGGKILAFVAFFLLPVIVTYLGATSHLEHAKSTQFCLSCHTMEPYGKSLDIADTDYLPAAHYQNKRIDRDAACYTCHTTYTLFGDVQAKLKGLRHVYIYYLGPTPEKVELYEPYSNRECLHCHGGARSFEESELHLEFRDELQSGETSCLECHDRVHEVDHLDETEMWEGTR